MVVNSLRASLTASLATGSQPLIDGNEPYIAGMSLLSTGTSPSPI